MTREIWIALIVMGTVSYACRAGGFLAMRYVPLRSRRVRAWLNGIPISIMGAVLAPAVLEGGPPEWLGCLVAGGMFKATGSDIAAVAGAVMAVAVARALAG